MGEPAYEAECPLCGSTAFKETYELLLHMETLHAEGESAFVPKGSVTCPQEGCNEPVPEDDMEQHILLHNLEEEDAEPTKGEDGSCRSVSRSAANPERKPRKAESKADALRSSRSDASNQSRRPQRKGVIQAWKELLDGSTPSAEKEKKKRTRHKIKVNHAESSKKTISEEDRTNEPEQQLGNNELGKHGHEKHMPNWLVQLLQEDDLEGCTDVIPVLRQLLEHSQSTEYAYLCHPKVQHVSKLRREGGFCGYRNIQMLISHIIDAKIEGSQKFGHHFPTIFQIQDLIENAWDSGFNSQGRLETGGIRGTRKYIGTPEAQALFCSLGLVCSVQAFKDQRENLAEDRLLQAIERYFTAGFPDEAPLKTRQTTLPPIYFQYRGHSLTIVGIEKEKKGLTNLIVFDPSFRDSNTIRRLIGKDFKGRPAAADDALEAYRRGHKHLKRHHEFEVLYLTQLDTRPILNSD